MRRVRIFFNGVVVGALLAGVAGWFLLRQAREHPEEQENFDQSSSNATAAAGEVIYQSGVALQAKLESLDLTPDKVKEELARTGKIVRHRAQELAGQAADAAADTAATAAIKAKLAANRDLSVWAISVSTTDGHVTLDGTASSTEQVAEAVALALDTPNVRDVTANLKVQSKTP